MDSIGILDSGVGGLSVLRHVQTLLPQENLVYVADQAHVPYGPRPASEVQGFSRGITRFLLAQNARLIIVACNTASAAALTDLRQTFPDVPFVGMEPAVKMGAATTRSGKVGVMATAGTFESQRYASLMHRFAQDVELYQNPCRGLVELIEAGQTEGADTAALLQDVLSPMLAAGIDTLILGCTHYPFVLPLLQTVAGPNVTIIDPAPAVARQARRVLQNRSALNATGSAGWVQAYTTGNAGTFATLAHKLLQTPLPARPLCWTADGDLHAAFCP